MADKMITTVFTKGVFDKILSNFPKSGRFTFNVVNSAEYLSSSLSNSFLNTSVESCNKTLHIEAWDDPIEPMDKIPLLPY